MQPPSLCNGESDFSPQRIECPFAICRGGKLLLCTEERVSSLDRGENAPLVCVEGGVSLFYQRSREILLVLRSLDTSMMMYPVVWEKSDCHFAKGSAVASRIHWQTTCQLMRLSSA